MPALENFTFSLAIINNSYFTVDRLEDGTLVERSGHQVVILKILSAVLGFKYRLMMSEGNQGNQIDEHVGMITNEEADFTVCYGIVQYKLIELLKYSPTCGQIELSFLTRKMDEYKEKVGLFLFDPLQKSLWMCLILFILSFSIVLNVIQHKWKSNSTRQNRSYWQLMALVMGFGKIELPRRELFGLAVMSFIIFIGCSFKIYGSILSASVNTKESIRPINTAEELIEAIVNRNLTIGTFRPFVAGLGNILQGSSRYELRYLGHILQTNGNQSGYSEVEAWEAIQKGNFAYIISPKYFYHQLSPYGKKYSLNNVHVPKESLLKANLAMFYGNSFKYTDVINECLSRMLSSGIMQRLVAGEDIKTTEQKKHYKIIYIDLADLDIALVALLIMYGFSVLTVILENLYFYHK